MSSHWESPSAAQDTLGLVERVQREMHSMLSSIWFSLVFWGTLWIVGAGVLAWRGSEALGLFWTIAGPLGAVTMMVYYGRRERRIGLESDSRRWILGAVAIVGGTIATGALGGALDAERLALLGPTFVVALGLAYFAWISRAALTAFLSAVLAVAASVALVAGGDDPVSAGIALSLGFGLLTVGAGLLSWLREHRTR